MERRTSFSKRIFSIMLSLLMVLSMLLYFPSGIFSNISFGLKASAEGTTNDFTLSAITGAPKGNSNEEYTNLFDGNTGTKWCFNFNGSAYVIFKASEPAKFSTYSIATGNDTADNSGRNPVKWTLSACMNYTGDTTSWTVIDTVTDGGLPAANETYTDFTLAETTPFYQYFKLEVTELSGGGVLQISEIALKDYTLCEHQWEATGETIASTCTEYGYNVEYCPLCQGTRNVPAEDALGHDFVDEICTRCGLADTTPKEPSTDVNGVYQIGTAGELYWFADKVNNDNANYGSANAVLTADITVNQNVLNENGELNSGDFTSWTSIGKVYNNRYMGTFNGNCHIISGLFFDDSNALLSGLFGYVGQSGSVYNVGVVDSYFKANNYVGGVCAYNYNIIKNCYTMSKVIAKRTSAIIGGVCGVNKGGTIANCYKTGTVIENKTYNEGGGVCGYNYEGGTVINCYFDSTIFNGIAIGANGAAVTNTEGRTTAQFSSGEVAFLLSQGCTVGDTTYDGSVWGQTIGTENYPVLGGEKVYYGFANCNESEEKIYSNNKLSESKVHNYDNGFCKGCGVYQPAAQYIIGEYEISNAGQLYWFADKVNNDNANYGSANAILTSDITVNGNVLNKNGELNGGNFRSWTPIGKNISISYKGTFDGQNHTVSGLYLKNNTTHNAGLIGFMSGGKISNVGIVDSYIYGGDQTGGICGYNASGTITNCYNKGVIKGSNNIGGICGYQSYGEITNCYSTGSVSGTSKVGSICGYAVSGTITNCYYLAETEDENGGKTAAQFSSGEVAYLLSQGKEGYVWGQPLSVSDSYPILDSAYKVYYGYVNCDESKEKIYSNTALTDSRPDHHYPNGICTVCGKYEPAEQNADGYYEIGNAGQLYWFANYVNSGNTSANAVLTADITVNTGNVANCGGTKADGWIDWTIIGNSSNKYTGTFDGQNYTISGLYFNNTSIDYVGLFGFVGSGGEISNVGVVNSYFKGKDYVGGVCGQTYDPITNCYNTGNVSGSNRVGGVCGESFVDKITNCYNTGTVSGSDKVGGVCGFGNGSTITNCYNTGEVTATGAAAYVGGVCGESGGKIINCYNTGKVDGSFVVGGVCGRNGGTITNCYFDSNKYSGNAVGYNNDTVSENVLGKTTVQFNSGEVAYLLSQGKEGYVWGQPLSVSDSYPILDSAYKVYYGYVNCDESKEKIYSNTALTDSRPDHHYPNGICTVCGKYEPAEQNADGYYEIGNAGQLYWFANYVNSGNTSANAVLTADITVNTGNVANCGGTKADGWIDWTIIGNSSNKYTGTFDGQNYTISGLYFNNTSIDYVGLFGFVGSGGEISNVGVVNSYFKGKDYVGGVCGQTYDPITNCYNTGNVSGSNRVGGVCGESFVDKITNCYNTGTVSGSDKVGGVCGFGNGSTITNCYNTGEVTATGAAAYVGGVCGESGGKIINCYNTGKVDGSFVVGGVCGRNGGTITNCYFDSNKYSGNAVGYNNDTVSENVLGKTTVQFNSGEVAYLLSQGCTVGETIYDGSVWGQTIGAEDYPVLGSKKVLANVDQSAFANDIIVYGQSASLDGTIGFNIYVSADDSYEWNTTIGGVTGVKNKDGLYVFTYNVAAKDMDKSINFTVNDKIDVTVSVSKYLDELSETDNESLKNLADSMSAYGNAAKAFFSNGTVAEQTIADDLSVYDFTVAMPEGISYYGSSLILESETTIRHYFKLAEGQNIANFAFTVDGESVEPDAKQGYYYIDIQNISAKKLGTSFSVSVNGEEVITNYSALSYVNKVLDSDSTDDNLKNLVKALYIYNQNALAYNPA